LLSSIHEEDIIQSDFIKLQQVVTDEILDQGAGIYGVLFPGCFLVEQLHVEMDVVCVDVPQVDGVDDVVLLQLRLLLYFLPPVEEGEGVEGDVGLLHCDFF
jgi:hypothetical protein